MSEEECMSLSPERQKNVDRKRDSYRKRNLKQIMDVAALEELQQQEAAKKKKSSSSKSKPKAKEKSSKEKSSEKKSSRQNDGNKKIMSS